MYREIIIGSKTVPMLANGATPIRYRMTFRKDLISEFENIQKGEGVSTSISELAYIMAKAAESQNDKKPMAILNIEDYIEWLEQFEALDITMAAEEIVSLYMGNEEQLSEAKKKAGDAVKDN